MSAVNEDPRIHKTHVFPAQSRTAFAAVYISHDVIACGHLAFGRFAMDHVYTASQLHDSRVGQQVSQ